MVPKHILARAADPNTAPFNNAPVGTGPFKWVERVPGDYITLAANTDFYGEGPHLERLIIKYVPDLTVLYTQFRTGDIDYIGLQGITADHYEEATKLADRVIPPVPMPFVENIACNLGLPQLKELFELSDLELAGLMLLLVLLAGAGSVGAEFLARRRDSALAVRVALVLLAVGMVLIGLAADQFLATELRERAAVGGGAIERVVLLGGNAGQRLEPVREVRRAVFDGPILERRGDGVGRRRVERLAAHDGVAQRLICRLRQPGLLDLVAEHARPERLFHVRRRMRDAPLGHGPIADALDCLA